MDMMEFENDEEREQFQGFVHWVAFPETQPMEW